MQVRATVGGNGATPALTRLEYAQRPKTRCEQRQCKNSAGGSTATSAVTRARLDGVGGVAGRRRTRSSRVTQPTRARRDMGVRSLSIATELFVAAQFVNACRNTRSHRHHEDHEWSCACLHHQWQRGASAARMADPQKKEVRNSGNPYKQTEG